jgi:hypothetical protein
MLDGMDRPTFTFVVLGTATDPAFVEAKLGELLREKLRAHGFNILAGGSLRVSAAVFAERHGLRVDVVEDPDPRDFIGATRNTALLRDGNAFLAFGPESGLSPADADLL